MCTGPRLVDDLIPHILNAYDHWWPRDFVRLASVSPVWLGHARKRLYECPSLQTPSECILFARAIEGNPHLSSLVRGIELRPASDHTTGSGCPAKFMASLRRILSLGGLQKVTLGGRLAIAAERFLQFLANPQIVTELCIDGSNAARGLWDQEGTGSLEWDDMTAFRFVRLQTLALSNLELTVLSWSTSCARLANLALDNVAVVAGSVMDIANDSMGTICSLRVCVRDVSYTTATDQLVCTLLERCSRLEFFCYEHLCYMSHSVRLWGTECLSIRRLRLSGHFMTALVLASIAERCRNLEELEVVGRDVCVVPSQWTHFITSNALPVLRQLRVSPPKSCPPNSCETMQAACDERKISLSFDSCLSEY